MTLLAWEDVTWSTFVDGLEGFRGHLTTDRGIARQRVPRFRRAERWSIHSAPLLGAACSTVVSAGIVVPESIERAHRPREWVASPGHPHREAEQ
jgi:hypothetical protein